jgi:hypothetical protein
LKFTLMPVAAVEGGEDLFGQRGIAGPAGEVHFARRGERLGRDDRRRGKDARTGGGTLAGTGGG